MLLHVEEHESSDDNSTSFNELVGFRRGYEFLPAWGERNLGDCVILVNFVVFDFENALPVKMNHWIPFHGDSVQRIQKFLSFEVEMIQGVNSNAVDMSVLN